MAHLWAKRRRTGGALTANTSAELKDRLLDGLNKPGMSS